LGEGVGAVLLERLNHVIACSPAEGV